MKKKTILSLIFGIFLFVFILSSINATSSDLVFKQNEIVNYSFICLDQNNSYCGTGVNCGITINYPNGTNFVTNDSMTSTPTSVNYVLDTSQIGIYNWLIVCSGSSNAISEGDYEVNKIGLVEKTSNSILYVILLLVVVFLFCLSLFGAIKLPFKNNREAGIGVISINKLKYFKITLSFITYLLLIWILNLLLTIGNNFNILSQYTKLFEVLFRILVVLAYPLFIVMIIIFFIVAIKDSKIKRLLKDGFHIE